VTRQLGSLEVERDADRERPAYGLLVARHGLTVTLGRRVYRIRRLRLHPMPPASDRDGLPWLPLTDAELAAIRLCDTDLPGLSISYQHEPAGTVEQELAAAREAWRAWRSSPAGERAEELLTPWIDRPWLYPSQAVELIDRQERSRSIGVRVALSLPTVPPRLRPEDLVPPDAGPS